MADLNIMHGSLHKTEVPFARNKEGTENQSTKPVNWGYVAPVDDYQSPN